ncbi:hypothetical protein NDU88_006756 [Pleurodeles waltl]|uniref:Uncharacterized protein n=1 Tax=Pleurodeles waltl TaxID=8319 RepID=A0AAV7VRJ2_PLEWA|nr:hypothetical protein NDU88_006756 [Pleurodeles waltl]
MRIRSRLRHASHDRDHFLLNFVKHHLPEHLPKWHLNPLKVVTRTSTIYITEQDKNKWKESYERRKQMMHSGFFTPNNKPFSILGTLITDNKDLFADCLSAEDQMLLKTRVRGFGVPNSFGGEAVPEIGLHLRRGLPEAPRRGAGSRADTAGRGLPGSPRQQREAPSPPAHLRRAAADRCCVGNKRSRVHGTLRPAHFGGGRGLGTRRTGRQGPGVSGRRRRRRRPGGKRRRSRALGVPEGSGCATPLARPDAGRKLGISPIWSRCLTGARIAERLSHTHFILTSGCGEVWKHKVRK